MIRSLVSTALAASLLACALPVSAALPPSPAAPAGFSLIDGAGGGRILEGDLGSQPTPSATFHAGLGRARRYFGGRATLLGAVRSADGTMTLGLFKATSAGTAVGGLLLTTFVAKGVSRVDVLFDRAGDVDRSIGGLLSQVAARHPGPSSSGTIAVNPVTAPDGSVHAVLPADWHPVVFAQGQFVAVGPDGAEVDQEVSINCVDPRSSLANSGLGIQVPYSTDVTQAYLSALEALTRRGAAVPRDVTFTSVKPQPNQPGGRVVAVEGTETLRGQSTRFEGKIFVSEVQQSGTFIVSLKMISAPAGVYRRDTPLMAAIYNSYNVDQGVRARQVADTIREDEAGIQRTANMQAQAQAHNAATFAASMDHARSVQQGIDRSTSGFVHYLNDTTVLEGPGGTRGTANSTFAQNVVNGDPQNYRIVPVSEYGAGD